MEGALVEIINQYLNSFLINLFQSIGAVLLNPFNKFFKLILF